MSNHYQRINGASARFMSKNSFIKWWFSWASNFQQDFRQTCYICKNNPKVLACDGTKVGVGFRLTHVTPIEAPTSDSQVSENHKKNQRAFINFKTKDKDQIKKACRQSRNHLLYMAKKMSGDVAVADRVVNEVEQARNDNLLLHIHDVFRPIVSSFILADFPADVLQCLTVLFRILATDVPVSSLIPYRYLDLVKKTCDAILRADEVDLKIFSSFSPEIHKLMVISSNLPCYKEITLFVKHLAQFVEEVHMTDRLPQVPEFKDGTYDPEKYGRAYYFTPSGQQLRDIPCYDLNKSAHSLNYDDPPETSNLCSKRYPEVSRKGSTYLFLWFDPLHYGHCYGYHMIPVVEGRKDPFSSIYAYMENPPSEIFYDFACQLEEYSLNREPGFWRGVRFWHDIFHGFSHKCPPVYSSRRIPALKKINTEICEQFNSFIQRIKYSARSMSQMHFNFYLQFFCDKWNNMKKRSFIKRCAVATDFLR